MQNRIQKAVQDYILAAELLKTPKAIGFIEETAKLLIQCFNQGCKVLVAGNGGSLCDAMHFAEELTGFYRSKRPALPAIALADPGHLTCVGNDVGFDQVFSRYVEALGNPGDLFIGLTTSGNSSNLLLAFERAKAKGLQTVAFLGKGGGKAKGMADLEWIIDGFSFSDRIQELHMAAIHMIIEAVEASLFSEYACQKPIPAGLKDA